MAAFLGRDPGDVVFTSGGTESANLAVLGTAEAAVGDAVVLYSAVEHPAVRESAPSRGGGRAWTCGSCRSTATASSTSTRWRGRSPRRAVLVAVMTANNETGVVQPRGGRGRGGAAPRPAGDVFTDAVQAAPWLDLVEVTAGADLVSVSAHKVGGPVGHGRAGGQPAGAARRPRQHGGGQERERRSGTQDVVGAVGLAAALRLVAARALGGGATGGGAP